MYGCVKVSTCELSVSVKCESELVCVCEEVCDKVCVCV